MTADADALNAARWVFVRDNWHNLCTSTATGAGGYRVVEVFVGVGEHEQFAPGSLDAAVDAALAAILARVVA